MLIGTVTLTDNGIAIYDVDNSHVKINAADALDLEAWLKARHATLVEIMRRQQKQAKEQATMDTDGGEDGHSRH